MRGAGEEYHEYLLELPFETVYTACRRRRMHPLQCLGMKVPAEAMCVSTLRIKVVTRDIHSRPFEEDESVFV